MKLRPVVLDFETYWDDDFSMSRMTTEAYVRDPRFEVILVGIKEGEKKARWVPRDEVYGELLALNLHECAAIAHHAHFDGLVLSHHYGLVPRMWIDTLSMSRVVHGAKGGNSLATLAKRYDLGEKGLDVLSAKGMRYKDMTPAFLKAYGRYCCNDCDLEWQLAKILGKHFPQQDELLLIDRTVRMFTEPMLWLHTKKLRQYIDELAAERTDLLTMAGVQQSDLTSNQKFAEVLERLGITPPKKVSPRTGKLTYAFAKTDPMMIELAAHPDDIVQAVIAARLNVRSTINQTRAERMIDMAGRGAACIYINHAGAGQTMRGAGGDKMNWQNLQRKGLLREAIEAPEGYLIVVGDSANIESRLSDWVAGQDDQVEAYRLYDRGEGPDIYCVMAEKIYGRTITKEDDPNERQMGKTVKLGLGFGMGPPKFIEAVRMQTKGKELLSAVQSEMLVSIYRSSHHMVVKAWRRCDEAIGLIAQGKEGVAVDYRGIVKTCKGGLLLPNGLIIKYPDLKHDGKDGWTYFDGKARQKIYGAKMWENIVQALARIVVMYQCLKVPYYWVLAVHDEGVWCVRKEEAEACAATVNTALRTPLSWCADLPLNCDVGYHKSYGKAKEN